MKTIVSVLLFASLGYGQYSGSGTARKLRTGSGAPASADCDSASEVGNVYINSDATAGADKFWHCRNNGGAIGWAQATGGAAAAGGSNGQVQFNSTGSLGGILGSAVDGSGNLSLSNDLTVTGDVNNSGAATTRPSKSGTSLPVTCTTGETYIKTDATAAQQFHVCTATNTWTVQGGASGMSAATHQSGSVLRCTSSSGTTAHTCTMSPALTTYTDGMLVEFEGTVTGISGASSLNIDSLGVVAIKLADGSSDPGTSQIAVGQQVALRYDGTVFRLPVPHPAGASGTVQFNNSGVFGGVTGSSVDGSGNISLSNDLTITGDVNNSGATTTRPSKSGTSLPGTCTVGETYIKTDATATQQFYVCTSTNTWTAQAGTGAAANREVWIPVGGISQSNESGSRWGLMTGGVITYSTWNNDGNQRVTHLSFGEGVPTDSGASFTEWLPANWTGTINLILHVANVTNTSGDVRFDVSVSCPSTSDDVRTLTWNTASSVTHTPSVSIGRRSVATFSSLATTGCSASNPIIVRVVRDADHAGDGRTDAIGVIGAVLQTSQ